MDDRVARGEPERARRPSSAADCGGGATRAEGPARVASSRWVDAGRGRGALATRAARRRRGVARGARRGTSRGCRGSSSRTGSAPGVRHRQVAACPGDPDVAEAPLLFERERVLRGCACAGRRPLPCPVRNTASNSRPLATCSVMSETRPPVRSSSSLSATSAMRSKNPSSVSYSAAAPASSARFSRRDQRLVGALGLEQLARSRCGRRPPRRARPARRRRASRRAPSSSSLQLVGAAQGRSGQPGLVRARDRLGEAHAGAPRRSAPSLVTDVAPMPRLGTFTMRRAATSSWGFAHSRRYASTSFTSRRS